MGDGTETAEAAARRFAHEMERLRTGLEERGIPLTGPIGTAAVDAALHLADQVGQRRAPAPEVEVQALAYVITQAWENGIRAGHLSLARWILGAGYRRA